MDDIISRAAVVDAIEGVDWYHINKNGEMVHGANDNDHQAWYKAEDIYKAVGSVPSAQRWIPCSERLPEDGRVVLWCNEHGSVFTTAITARFDNSWAVGKRHRSSRMVAWMPIPEPYRPKGDDKHEG